jgi:hypothetical protein
MRTKSFWNVKSHQPIIGGSTSSDSPRHIFGDRKYLVLSEAIHTPSSTVPHYLENFLMAVINEPYGRRQIN